MLRRSADLPDDPRAALAELRDPWRRWRGSAAWTWLRSHPLAADALLAALLFVVGLSGIFARDLEKYPGRRAGDAIGAVLVVLLTFPVATRRRYPRAGLFIALVATTPLLALNYADNTASMGGVVLLYTAATIGPRRRALVTLGWTIGMVLPVLIAGVIAEQEKLPIPLLVANLAIYVGAWALGDAARNRRDLVASLEQRAADAERERAVAAERAVEEERARIARELHDVVAHGLSVMVVQAGGARRIVEVDPARALEALRVIEATGRESMAEMRRLLGVLRDGDSDDRADDPARLTPQPGLDAIDALAAQWTDAGLPVHIERRGPVRRLPSGQDVAAYRIVQEAVTNTSKHAGAARVDVTVTFTDTALELVVADDGRGASAPDDGNGQGLVGMRERAALYGGSVDAGPKPGGGWVVRAVLPAVVEVTA